MTLVRTLWFLLAGAAAFIGFKLFNGNTNAIDFAERQKGVCWVGSREEVNTSHLQALRECGVNRISQTPFGWQPDPVKPDLRFESKTNKPWWGESFEGLAATTAHAKELGIQTVLKPHLWVRHGWPGDVVMQNEEDWKAWFKNYEQFILAYAAIADSCGMATLCIGTELQQTVHRPEWKTLIGKIRQRYKGALTYAANFNEFERVAFWDQLDFIGIQAYFPLTKRESPDVSQLVDGWQQPLARIERIHKKFNKPVIFTEIGYKSTRDAAVEPWQWPHESDQEKISHETQAVCYEAFFTAAWKKDWLAGVYFWKWYPQPAGRHRDFDFTPQQKPAEKVMAKWFKQQ